MGHLSQSGSNLKRLPVPLGGLVAIMQKTFKPADLKNSAGIVVINGPGPFSSIRTGVLAANLLARILHKPLYAVQGTGVMDAESISADIISGELKPVRYAEPVYDAEPNITISNKI